MVGYCKEGHLIDLRNIEDLYVGYVGTPEESEEADEDVVLVSDHESDEEEEAEQLEIGDDGGEGLYEDQELLPVDTAEVKEMRCEFGHKTNYRIDSLDDCATVSKDRLKRKRSESTYEIRYPVLNGDVGFKPIGQVFQNTGGSGKQSPCGIIRPKQD